MRTHSPAIDSSVIVSQTIFYQLSPMQPVNVNINNMNAARYYKVCGLVFVFIFVLAVQAVPSQDKKSAEVIIPSFKELLKTPVEIAPNLKGVHPRLFFKASDIAAFQNKAKGSGRDFWREALDDVQTLKRPVPNPSDEDLYKSGLDQRKSGSITQYEMAFQIAETAFAYSVERDDRYLKAAKAWTLAACEMPMWGYTYNKPNVDLPPAHLLYAVGFAYDVLYDKLSAAERNTIRTKLLTQGRLMYDYFKYKKGKRYTYTQNHTWIPMAGLAIAAYAIMDEEPEAKQWAQLSRAVFERTMTAFGTDGYFYESFHYFGFAFRWMVRYFDAHLASTGENLYLRMKPKFDGMKYFVMHSVLPDRKNVFDFADIGDGSSNRNGTGQRESIYSEYDILYRFAQIYRDPQAQAVGDFLRTQTELKTREPMWAFINRDNDLKPASLSQIPLWHHFKDNDTIFWRSDWTKNATAFAFRCSPPEGHHAARLASSIPDWRQNTGHAHPDANSFIIWAHGRYLTGDTGYLGIKQTDDHNTVLIDGRGQEKDGVYEMFKDVPNERLDKIRLTDVSMNADGVYAKGEAASGYFKDVGVTKFDRHFFYSAKGYFVIWDDIETSRPSAAAFLLNADRDIKNDGSMADLLNVDAGLRVVQLTGVKTVSEIKPQMVQARGLPGSVDKGDSEQRGMQLRLTTEEKLSSVDFLNVLLPYRTAEMGSIPKLTRTSTGQGFVIRFVNGSSETVCVDGDCNGLRSRSGAVVVHSSTNSKSGSR